MMQRVSSLLPHHGAVCDVQIENPRSTHLLKSGSTRTFQEIPTKIRPLEEHELLAKYQLVVLVKALRHFIRPTVHLTRADSLEEDLHIIKVSGRH